MFDPEAVISISILMVNVLLFEYLVQVRVSSSLKLSLLSDIYLYIESQIPWNWKKKLQPVGIMYYTFLAISEFQFYINKIFYNGLYLSIFTQNLSLDAKSPAPCVWLIPSLDISDWLLSCNIYYHFFSKFSSVASWSLAAWDIIQHEVRTKWG